MPSRPCPSSRTMARRGPLPLPFSITAARWIFQSWWMIDCAPLSTWDDPRALQIQIRLVRPAPISYQDDVFLPELPHLRWHSSRLVPKKLTNSPYDTIRWRVLLFLRPQARLAFAQKAPHCPAQPLLDAHLSHSSPTKSSVKIRLLHAASVPGLKEVIARTRRRGRTGTVVAPEDSRIPRQSKLVVNRKICLSS